MPVTRSVTKPLRVLIVEPDHTGHRLSGVRVLIDALTDLRADFPDQSLISSISLATSTESVASTEFATQLTPVAARIEIVPIAGLVAQNAPWRNGIAKLRAMVSLVRAGDYDHVYIPYGDGLIQLQGAFGWLPGLRFPPGVQGEAIMMRGSFAYPQTSWLARFAALHGLASRRLSRIHLIDPAAHHTLAGLRPDLLDRVRLLPDPISPTEPFEQRTARQALGLPTDGRLIGCMGRIDQRKGGDLLVKAFLKAPLHANDRLLLAGVHEAQIRTLLRQADHPRIISIDRYLTETELCQAISAVDLMATPYPNFIGSASMVIRAAAAARPCVAADDGWMGQIVPRFKLGRVCRVTDTDGFAQTLMTALDESGQFTLTPSAKAFIAYGNSDNVHGHWTALIRERLGLPASNKIQAWPG